MNKTVQYSENDLASLISDVEDKFSKHLAKAETGSEDPIENKEEVAAASQEGVESEVAKTEGEAEVISFDYDDKDIEEMDEMYSSMTKSEKEAHYKSIKKSIFGGNEEAPAQVAKSESAPAEVKKTEAAPASKNSDEVAELKGKLEKTEENYADLQKNFQELLGKLGGFVTKGKEAPKQKAITKIEYIAKSEEVPAVENKDGEKDLDKLDKNEIASRLSAKVRSGKLEKADKDAINTYYLDRKENIESIRHLL